MKGAALQLVSQIASGVPECELVGATLITRPTRHLVRGFRLERTSRSSEYYMLSLIYPLFTPFSQSLSLNYSNRITITAVRAEPIRLENHSDIADAAQSIQKVLTYDELPRWKKISETADFLGEFGPRGDLNRPNVALELAIAQCLSDDINGGTKRLSDVVNWHGTTPILPQVKVAAREVQESLINGAAAFASLVEAFETRNVDKYFPGLTRA